eukprot:GILK01003183.1.p1 GENE.GILK01003183.1~~GILK01003183.1.p1  ORF type:complete len:358 (-),score=53.11 GILK01003183.1:90-1163(-)
MEQALVFQQEWPRPSAPRPVVIIGAGGIVRTAHLPAYRKLDIPIKGIYDLSQATAQETAKMFDLALVYESLDAAVSQDADAVIFDIAVPATAVLSILQKLPNGAAVLIQKPMGNNLAEATAIRDLCKTKQLKAAINFQARFSPNILALKDMISQGVLDAVSDVEVRECLHHPWDLWSFLKGIPRVEILYHSIHEIDFIRFLVGEPTGVYCKALRDPAYADYADTKSITILDYGEWMRCVVSMEHSHNFNTSKMMSQIKVTGTKATAVAKLGVYMNYPVGEPDTLEFAYTGEKEWRNIPVKGSWFIDAFLGPMSNLQRFVSGEDEVLVSSVEDAWRTMAVVEACYNSSKQGGHPIASS